MFSEYQFALGVAVLKIKGGEAHWSLVAITPPNALALNSLVGILACTSSTLLLLAKKGRAYVTPANYDCIAQHSLERPACYSNFSRGVLDM